LADQILNLAKKSHIATMNDNFFNRTTFNLDGTVSYVYKSGTTFEQKNRLTKKTSSSLRS